ncbi:hypothetical protein SAMN05421659_101320 [[Clostridium] fimetarium]|uniref:Uncharacterized protein n=1 Tax=[Clostridium] fimetarium TaxID=99656 RepID=A0A1I0MB54_9FIRM|nr:hypothetical protein SAMN05421659_101320 [[Clostridium] fimetarium]
MEREVTMEEIVKLVKDQEGDFIIHISMGEEADTDAKEE